MPSSLQISCPPQHRPLHDGPLLHPFFGTHSPSTHTSLAFEQHSRYVPSPLWPHGWLSATLQQKLGLKMPGLMQIESTGQHWSFWHFRQQPPVEWRQVMDPGEGDRLSDVVRVRGFDDRPRPAVDPEVERPTRDVVFG